MDWIEQLAREHGTGGWQTLEDMVNFGKSVAEAMREKCAIECDKVAAEYNSGVARVCAEKIRRAL